MKLYQVFNGFENRIFEADSEIMAKNGADACRKMLKKIGKEFTDVKRSASSFVRIKATPIKIVDGKRYFDGAASWFEVYGENGWIL